MKIYDISLPVTAGMPVWPGHPPVEIRKFRSMAEGEKNNVSYIGMTVHTGTHVDSPSHFISDGESTENLSLQTLIGPVVVVEIPSDDGYITAGILKQCSLDAGEKRVLFKTANSYPEASKIPVAGTEPVALGADGASFLIDLGVGLVGIDSQSIASVAEGVLTHQLLLEAGMIILEGLDLADVVGGRYDLFCLPLKTIGLDGAPARAVLVQR